MIFHHRPRAPGALLPPDAGRDRPLCGRCHPGFPGLHRCPGCTRAWQQAENWTSDLETNLTVQIRPVIDSDVEADAQQAADLIATLDGVEQATARDRAYAEALVAPWLGSGNILNLPCRCWYRFG